MLHVPEKGSGAMMIMYQHASERVSSATYVYALKLLNPTTFATLADMGILYWAKKATVSMTSHVVCVSDDRFQP